VEFTSGVPNTCEGWDSMAHQLSTSRIDKNVRGDFLCEIKNRGHLKLTLFLTVERYAATLYSME
jgi:hypothetical protein